jgi:ribonucrease Y
MSFFGNLSTLFGNQNRNKKTKFKTTSIKTQDFKDRGKQKSNIKFKQDRSQKPHHQVKKTHQSMSLPHNIEQIKKDAEAKAREIVVEAKSEALSLISKAEEESKVLRKQLEGQQKVLEDKLDRIDSRLETISQKEEVLDKKRLEIQELKQKVQEEKERVINRLEEVSGLTRDEAREMLFERLEKKLNKEMALFIRQKEEEALAESEEKVQEILIDAMKHGATDYVPEYTVSVVTIPSEETKGKIIGKSGRNINAFERITGVDVDLDVSPTEVRLSCFDPVRREVARIALEKLIKDGRIQPTRIEEVVSKVEGEMDKTTLEAGKKLCHDVGIYNLPVELMRLLGRFKFRFSYGQNLIAHTLEETRIGIKIAHELGLDVNVVKMGCLLHDIGKVSNEAEGSHVELGVKIAKKFNLPQPVIDCIAQHHEDEPFTGPEQMAVYIADAVSGARPGARYENYDEYVERLQKLEEIATKYKEVKQAYAIQAGREVRVLLEPENSKDDDVKVLSLKIRDEIKESVTYPGTVTVTVIRETRGQEVAK